MHEGPSPWCYPHAWQASKTWVNAQITRQRRELSFSRFLSDMPSYSFDSRASLNSICSHSTLKSGIAEFTLEFRSRPCAVAALSLSLSSRRSALVSSVGARSGPPVRKGDHTAALQFSAKWAVGGAFSLPVVRAHGSSPYARLRCLRCLIHALLYRARV